MDTTAVASKPVRLRDIAKLAGVHVTAVSAVLSPRATTRTRVSDETAQRIRELAARLNYRPHLPAQIMRRQRTGLIGLLEFGRSEASTRRINALARELSSRGYHVLTTNVLWFNNVGEAIDSVLNAQVEGVILIMMTGGTAMESVHRIQQAGVPCVAFNGVRPAGMPQARSAMQEGLEMLTEHLLGLGHRKLTLLSARNNFSDNEDICWPALERIAGFEAAIRRAGGEILDDLAQLRDAPRDKPVGVSIIEEAEPEQTNTEIGYKATARLLASGTPPEALICGNDRYAFGALRACFELGVQVPQEMAVVGFNGEYDTRFFCPALTTVDILDPDDAGIVIDLLVSIINKERPLSSNLIQRLPCRLIVRESCGSKTMNPHPDGRLATPGADSRQAAGQSSPL